MALNEVFATKGAFSSCNRHYRLILSSDFNAFKDMGVYKGNVDNRNTERTNIEIYVWNSAGSFTELPTQIAVSTFAEVYVRSSFQCQLE